MQNVAQIVEQWKAEGRTFRIGEAVREMKRQACQAQRDNETEILDTMAGTEVAQQVQEHRESNGADHAIGCHRDHD